MHFSLKGVNDILLVIDYNLYQKKLAEPFTSFGLTKGNLYVLCMVESFGNINRIITYAKNSNTKPLAAIGPLLNSSNFDNRPEADEPIISPEE